MGFMGKNKVTAKANVNVTIKAKAAEASDTRAAV
jgi:hypothetical protein